MVTFILPGYSPSNKDWAKEVAKNLKVDGQIRPVFWDHWRDPEEHFKPKEKARLLSDLAPNLYVNIIAKSVGTLVAAYILKDIGVQVKKVVLCGIPSVSNERLEIFKEAYAQFPPENVVCFQNEGDPFAKPDEIKKFMTQVNTKIEVVSKPRRDHHYPYFEEFNKFLAS